MSALYYLGCLLIGMVLLALWPWVTRWDRHISKTDDPLAVVMWIKHLVHIERYGFRVDLHKFSQADDPGCFHTHPAVAWRVVLWGGYWEEILYWYQPRDDEAMLGPRYKTGLKAWRPGNVGRITPDFSHRIAALYGPSSYSLWIRFRCTHEIHLQGWGWPADAKATPNGPRVRQLPSDEHYTHDQ